MENNMVVPQKIKCRITYDPAVLLLGYIPKRTEAMDLKGCLYTCVHSRLFLQPKGGSDPRVYGWMNGETNEAYTYNRLLFSLTKEGNPDTRYNVMSREDMLSEISQ